MKKFLSVLLSLVLVFGVSYSTALTPAEASQKLSGEQLFKGFVFAQGELGKSLDQVFNSKQVEKLNSKEGKKFANETVSKIKKADAKFFNEFKQAVYSKDALKVDKLLKEAGTIVQKEVQSVQKSLDGTGIGVNATVSVEWYYYYYYVAAAAAGLVLVLFGIDITPIAQNDNTDREMSIRALLDEVN